MNLKLLPVVALLLFAAAPVVMGSAEQSKDAAKPTDAKASAGGTNKADTKDGATAKADGETSEVADEKPARKFSNECIASEEVIADLEAREQKLKEREEKIKEREKDVAAQEASVKEEVAKIDAKRADLQSTSQKEAASREEQVNKLMETFEGMSAKAAAGVIAGVDDELAVLALGKLSSLKAGKILANLKPEQSAHLSELMAFGKTKTAGKEKANGQSNDRAPASKR